MQSYTFLSPSGPPREGQKNYVFVDEHNRHKRLKVMRACNGCRKRKIKCDAATTNTWPCSACQRLKLVCVPPTVNQDGDSQPDADKGNGADGSAYMEQRVSQPNAISHPLSMPPGSAGGNSHVQGNLMPYNALYQPYVTTPSQPVYSTQPPAIPVTHQAYHQPAFAPQYHRPQQQEQRPQQQHQEQQQQQQQHQQQQQQQQQPAPLPTSDSGIFLDPDQSTADGLSEAFGELKIDETGIAPYIRQQRKMTMEPEAFVQDDVESKLPALNTKAGSVVRIPPELMPSDEEAMEYFEVYFTDIHPYVPVVHRQSLYHQWRHDRSSISPLLLEALFACAGRMSDDPAQGAQWLALANRHEPSFMDVPRLSTIQALLLLLKARESNPTKGYFYRSWQTVKTMISMAKDLDIHEHYSLHKDGRTCNLDPVDCLVQTRVWQTLLVVEVMTGGPQGRSDYEVDPNTVDMRPSVDAEEGDPFEIDRSRQFSYFVRNAFNIRSFVEAYHRIKRQTKDWGSSPRFVESNPLFSDFIRLLPPDLQVSYPEDGSPPHLPSHFVGNLHCHYHLGIIMLHRPQLVSSKSFAAGGKWKTHMSLCYSSAKCLCRLQEAILERFGLRGLLFMQRGISFTIYSVLTCTMLHLVAITSPDPEFNSDARDYFTRHMRILEKCAAAWPIPEIQAQIESLRVAFSADTSKPFELKRTFPYGSPSESQASPPPFDGHYNNQYAQTSSPSQQIAFTSHPITPPASARAESNPHSPPVSNLSMMPHATTTQPLTMPLVDENSWDPTRIMTSWDLAFAVNSSQFGPSSPMNANQMVDSMPTQYTIQYPAAGKVMSMDASQAAIREQQPVAQAPVMMTARDWQQSVASVYDPHGIKRRWNYSVDLTHGSSRPG